MANHFSNIKIIGAGMPRTGTMSLKVALERLGYSQCYHMIDLMQNLHQVEDWISVDRKDKIDWDALFSDYQAIVDIPGQRYYQELMQAYPEAKVIATTRNPSKWYESLKQTIYQAYSLDQVESSWWWLHYPLSSLRKNKVLLGRLIGKILWEDYFEKQFEDKEFVIDVYENHLKAVQQHVPAEKLLIFDVADGWQPLCDFLGTICPKDEAFPHVNDRDHFQRFWQSLDTDSAKNTTEASNIIQKVAQHSTESANKISLAYGDITLTNGELYTWSQQIAYLLQRLDIMTGDRVALYLPNCPEFVASYLAIHQVGGVMITINTALTKTEVNHILADSRGKLIITTTVLQQQINRARHPELQHVLLIDGPSNHPDSLLTHLNSPSEEQFQTIPVSADDPAMLLYSSGTTGKPKGAVISHGNLRASANMVARQLKLTPADRVLLFLPLFHSYALTAILNSALYSKATLIILPEFESKQLLQAVQQHQVTIFFAVPTIYTLLIEQAATEQLKSVKQYISAGAALPLQIAHRWQKKFGVPIKEGLGFTEGSQVTLNPQPLEKPGSVGLPLSEIEIKVLNETGHRCETGRLGEIVVRGPNIMLGYWNQPEETIFDGWFHTGDIGRLDEDGYLYVVDRHKDMVNIGGEKVYPAEVEQVLYRHPAVMEAAVYGTHHSILGEEVHASIVLKTGQHLTDDEIVDFCRERLAHFKLPTVVEFIDALPKSKTGKVLKRVLRERVEEKKETDRISQDTIQPDLRQQLIQTASSDEQLSLLKQRINAEIRQIIGVELRGNQSVFDVGMDSLMSIQLTNRLSAKLGISLPSTLTLEYSTLDKLTRHLMVMIEQHNQSAPKKPTENHQPVAWNIYDWFPQSYIQQLYYGWHEAAENKSFMNMNFAVRVRSTINSGNLRESLQMLIDRHADLRLIYDHQNGVPVQKAQRHQQAFFVEKKFDCQDWNEVQDEILEVSQKPFDLDQDAMMRVYLFSRAPDDYILLVVRHHIMNDRTTARLVIDELFMLYQAKQTGASTPPVLVPSYFEFLQWHTRMLNDPEGQKSGEYWRQQLGRELEPLKLPTDFPRYPKNRHYGDVFNFELSTVLTDSLQQLAKKEKVTLYSVMMAAYQVLFHFHTGQQDILIDTSMINRTQKRFENTIGQISIIQTIRTCIIQAETFSGLLKKVQRTVWDALKHQAYPSQLLMEQLQPVTGYVYNRPGQVLLNLVSSNFSHSSLQPFSKGDLIFEPTQIVPAGSAGTFHEINTQLLEKDGKLIGHVNYETDLYKASTIQVLMANYEAILRKVVTNPTQPVSALHP